MITVPAPAARSCLGVFRRLPAQRRPRDSPPPLLGVDAGPGGLRLRFHAGDIAAEFHRPDPCPPAAFCVPLHALEAPAGSPVELDPSAGKPAGDAPRFPPWPGGEAENGTELVIALAEAARTAGREPCRRALSGVLLKGEAGEVVATDGRQLLAQGGFRFPWREDLLVPATRLFEMKDLRGKPALVARRKDHVLLRIGGWTIALKAKAGVRYPDIEAVIPPKEDIKATLRLDPADMEALLAALPRLPGAGERTAPVTLELGRASRLVAGDGEDAEELPLVGSKAEGRAVRVVMDRAYLARAVRLGFDQLHVSAPDRPVLCRDARQTYLWMPLDSGRAPARATMNPEPRKEEPVPTPPPNGTVPARHDPPAAFDPLAEADAVRALLAEAQSRLGRLVSALKTQRRQSRAVEAALASLRHLPPFAP